MKLIKILVISTALTFVNANSYSEEGKVDCSLIETKVKKTKCRVQQFGKKIGSFVSDSSKEAKKELERRLKNRAQDSNDVVAERMEKAASEITHWAEYDYVIVNENLDNTLSQVLNILPSERLRRHRAIEVSEFIEKLIGEQS